ncbi:hypothetical protein IMSAGC015_00867 [Lachnospiraceae bacterium]|nr:hypothetical protein IMSAGC015_00867 [Lachnospiraceae bacterium]
MKKKMFIIFTIVLIVVAIGYYRIPGKYAIEEKQLRDYENAILVEETFHTGTGWAQVGDNKGYFFKTEQKDIILEGSLPPTVDIVSEEGLNTFLCLVEYKGKEKFADIEEEFDRYDIKEWIPIYPIKRNTILPDFFYPSAYMTKWEIKNSRFLGD